MVWYFSTCHKLYTLFFISALERTQGKKHFQTVLQNYLTRWKPSGIKSKTWK